MINLLLSLLLLASGPQTKEETARGFYNQALLTADIEASDKLLDRIITEFPTTVTATEAIKLRVARLAARANALAAASELDEAKRRAREESLGGFQISEIVAHGLTIPIPNRSTYKRQGTSPEIIKLEAPGVADSVRKFFLTALPEYEWKSIGVGGRCWTQLNAKTQHTERLCFDVEAGGKASLYITTLSE